MHRTLQFLLLTIAGWAFHAAPALASEFCQRQLVAVQAATNGVAEIPIYRNECIRVAGAVAFDVSTRGYTSAWNQPDPRIAEATVRASCGVRCVAFAFYDDFAYVAIADNDLAYGISTRSADDAIARCMAAGGIGCAAVIGASSTARALYWGFGSVSYDVQSNASGRSANRLRAGDAHVDAMKQCGSVTCWTYDFQGGRGGIAKAADGRLVGAWIEQAFDSRKLQKALMKACRKQTGDKACTLVVEGPASDADSLERGFQEQLRRIEQLRPVD